MRRLVSVPQEPLRCRLSPGVSLFTVPLLVSCASLSTLNSRPFKYSYEEEYCLLFLFLQNLLLLIFPVCFEDVLLFTDLGRDRSIAQHTHVKSRIPQKTVGIY